MSEDSSGPEQPTNNDDSRDEVLRKRSFSRARGIDISSFMVTDDEPKSEPVEISQEVSQEPDIDLVMLTAGNAIPGDADLVIIPGTKSTIGDLKFLREQKWDLDLAGHINRGGYVLGICGGYQILGKTISDPEGIEGPAGTTEGLGYLDVQTTMTANKKVTPTVAVHLASGTQINGYEIHIGDTIGSDCSRPFAKSNGAPDGAVTVTGQIMGTYLHGLFSNNRFRQYFLKDIGAEPSDLDYDQEVENILDELADHIEKNVDIDTDNDIDVLMIGLLGGNGPTGDPAL